MRELIESGTLGADETVSVLEVGSGQGTFALNFVEALTHACGNYGRALAGRLRYVFSDYSVKNLEESTAHPGLARLVEQGTIVPAVFDLRQPGTLEIPDGASRKPRSPRARAGAEADLVAVFTNYICCVSPQKVIRKTDEGLFEKYVRLSIDVADETEARSVTKALTTGGRAAPLPPLDVLQRIQSKDEWRRLDLKRAFAAKIHREVVTDFAEALGPATINYPYSFLDLIRGLRPRLRPGGLFLVSDFGNPDRAEVQSPTNDRPPVRYGLSLTHDVDFGIFDAFADREGLGVVRTDNGLLDLHTVALRNMSELPASFVASFEQTHLRCEHGQDLLDLSAAAATLSDAGRFHEAARLYGQCLRIAPRSPQVIYRFGQACLSANVQSTKTLERLAGRLRLGRRLDLHGKHDFDTLLAGVYLRMGEAEKARRLLKRSLKRSESASKHGTLALVYERLGKRKRAYAAHLRALELEPESKPSEAAREKLVRDYLLGERAPVRWSARRRGPRAPR